MASYYIVVPRGNPELFSLLSAAFRGQSAFSVIQDRRTSESPEGKGERRGGDVALGPDEFIVAERLGARRLERSARSRTGDLERRAGSSGFRGSGRRSPQPRTSKSACADLVS
jgi:hypothetical protein